MSSHQLFTNCPWEVKAKSNVDLYAPMQTGNFVPQPKTEAVPVNTNGGTGHGAWALSNLLRQDIFKAYIPWFLYKPPFGYPRAVNPLQLRLFSENPYIFSVVKAIQDEVFSIPFDIKVKEEWAKQGMDYDDMDRQQILHFFDSPNENTFENFRTIMKSWIKDLCEIGESIGVKVFKRNGTFTQLVARDASTFLLNSDIFGMIGKRADFVRMPNQDLMMADLPTDYVEEYQKQLKEQGDTTRASNSISDKINQDMNKGPFQYMYSEAAAYFQYGWTPGSRPVPFGKREIIRIIMNPRTTSIYGQSPIEVLMNTILTLVYGGEYNLDFYLNNNLPNGVLVFKGVDATTAEMYRNQISDHMMAPDEFGNVKKRHFKVPITGYEASFVPMQMSSKEMEVIEQQKWFLKTLYACFGLNENEMGFVENVNHSNGDNQSKAVIRKMTKPFLTMIEDAINAQLMPEFGHPEFEFKFNLYDIDEDIKKHNLYQMQITMGIKTPQMVAEELGIDLKKLEETKQDAKDEEVDTAWEMPGKHNEPEKKKIEKKAKVVMESEELIKEHEHLIKVLTEGTKKEREDEAEKQSKELASYKEK